MLLLESLGGGSGGAGEEERRHVAREEALEQRCLRAERLILERLVDGREELRYAVPDETHAEEDPGAGEGPRAVGGGRQVAVANGGHGDDDKVDAVHNSPRLLTDDA